MKRELDGCEILTNLNTGWTCKHGAMDIHLHLYTAHSSCRGKWQRKFLSKDTGRKSNPTKFSSTTECNWRRYVYLLQWCQ